MLQQQDAMLKTIGLIEQEKTNKINEVDKCLIDAYALMNEVKKMKDGLESENNENIKL